MEILSFEKNKFVLRMFLVLLNCCAGVLAVQYGVFACDYEAGENMFNSPESCLPEGVPSLSIPDAISNAVNWLLEFSVMISVVALIYGGISYVFSSGDTQKAENAKKVVKYALLGIFVAGISYAIIVIIDKIFTP